MYDDYDDEDEDGSGGGSTGRKVAVAVAVLAVAAGGWFALTNLGGGDDGDGNAVAQASVPTAPERETSDTRSTSTSSEPTGTTADTASSTSLPPTTTAAPTVAVTEPAPTTAAPASTAAPAATPSTEPDLDVGYETMPDGSPVPVVALFGPSSITISGAVPSQAAKERLEVLARANAKPGQEAVQNLVTINPAVPPTVAVRVVELTSVRFPEGSAEILPPHALELDRVVGILNALPHVTALVIGHGDQNTDPGVSYSISKDRANSVVGYFVGRGIAPTRLSARAVGAEDLLSLNNEPAALELNRRTEFVFYGLLV